MATDRPSVLKADSNIEKYWKTMSIMAVASSHLMAHEFSVKSARRAINDAVHENAKKL